MEQARNEISALVKDIQDQSAAAAGGGDPRERYVIPPHLHDLQEADLPENQRGLVISEIAQFRERAAKKEREKQREVLQQAWTMGRESPVATPPRQNVGWGQRQPSSQTPPARPAERQGSASFVREAETPKAAEKTDEEMERERRDQRAREEHDSFRDVRLTAVFERDSSASQRERRWETRERRRITDIERQVGRERSMRDAEERDRQEIRERLHVWDDDESDELFYTDRCVRARALAATLTRTGPAGERSVRASWPASARRMTSRARSRRRRPRTCAKRPRPSSRSRWRRCRRSWRSSARQGCCSTTQRP